MILHTLNAAPTSAAYRDCLGLLGEEDALVLMGDGVYAALENTASLQALLDAPAQLYILAADAHLAGVPLPGQGVRSIDMDGLVALTEQFPRQQAWY